MLSGVHVAITAKYFQGRRGILLGQDKETGFYRVRISGDAIIRIHKKEFNAVDPRGFPAIGLNGDKESF